jgi:hypothetical protein
VIELGARGALIRNFEGLGTFVFARCRNDDAIETSADDCYVPTLEAWS